jgi:hypothetical protein
MSRRYIVLLAATGIMIAVAAMGSQKKSGLLVLEWAGKAAPEHPPLALLIELGRKDTKPAPWSGRAVVKGANVVHREGYCFQDKDKLVDPDSWEASSHRPLRVPRNNAALAATEGIFPVGIVLHLADVRPDARLTLTAGNDRPLAVVAVKDVLAGQTKQLWDGAAAVRLISTATPVETGRTEDDFPAACYGPDGTLWVAYISYTVKEESRRIEPPSLKEQPKDFKAYYTPEFGDQLFVKYYRDGKWSEPIAATGPKEDLVGCAIAAEGNSDVWVVYSANRKGNFQIFTRPISKRYNPAAVQDAAPRAGSEKKLTDGLAADLSPALCTDKDGALRGTFQSWQEEGGATFGLVTCRQGRWTTGLEGPIQAPNYYFGGPGTNWYPAIAAGPGQEVTAAYDFCDGTDYDVGFHVQTPRGASNFRAASSSLFEARPSICYDAKGRLWIAYEEGPENWGKNFGVFDDRGNPLYFARTVRVVCLVNGKLMRPVAELPPLTDRMACPDTGQKAEKMPRCAYPQIGIDGKGRVWLTYRQKFGTRYSTHPGSYWLTFARRLDGDKWSEPIEIHHSDGLLDSRPVLLPHAAGGLRIIHNTDNRFTVPDSVNNDIYMSYIDRPGDPVEPKLVPHKPGQKDAKLVQQAKEEQAAVKRIRDYRIEAGGKKYQLLRGEFHRHTEISWDGGPDGSLEDMFRYAIDAAGMDWIGNGDHDSGAGREYSWWLIQKFTDAYHVKKRFTPMFTYERSVGYPHGHRNCMFVQRGVRTLPRLAAPSREEAVGGVHADDTKMLYRYLKEFDGICAVHTSATGMGTDWRDNDPAVEPFVEIYQGDRMSYEIEGAPRAGFEATSGKKPVNIAGWYPKGFINHAFEKGYRLGFQSSSDHSSTHISYCIALAEMHDRESIMAAFKKRHCYGATDDIIVDVKSGDHIMGDEFQTTEVPKLQIHVVGTDTLSQIDILKDSAVVETIKPGKAAYQATWTDPKPIAGVHWYYIRVQQTNDEIAWGSPMWIKYSP